MSEFQYHEWQIIDRRLTPDEQNKVNRLSSHIEVNPSRAVVTYSWSDFKHDPREVLLHYFDAYLYMANWGSRRLMFRFRKGILNFEKIDQYCDGEFVSFATTGEYDVLEIDYEPEEGGMWIDEEETYLSPLIPIRADLLQGDYRILYLAWLKARSYEVEGIEDEESSEIDFEPPVPPGLQTLTPALEAFIEMFDLDPYLVQAAAEKSPAALDDQNIDYRDLVSRLPRSEADDFLVRLAEGDPGVRFSLYRRLKEYVPKHDAPAAEARPIQQLMTRAGQIEKAETKRQEEEARKRHIAEMEALANREEQVWKQVDDLLENGRRIASVYDEATRILGKLAQLADFRKTHTAFYSRIRVLAGKYGARAALVERWRTQGWL